MSTTAASPSPSSPSPAALHGAELHTSSLRVILALVRRNLIGMTRLPAAVVPAIVFPIFGTIAFSSVFGAAIRQYYPHIDPLNWYVPLNVLQGGAFGGVFLAFGTIRDFQTGVVDRLLTAPLRRRALLASAVAAAVVRVLLPFVIVVAIGAVGGMSLPGGFLALVVLFVAAAGTSAIGCMWGTGLAYRFKSMAAAPLMQVGVFVLVFLSATQVPMQGLSGWLHTVARINPATNILRLGRQGFLQHVTWHDTWPGLLAIAGGLVVMWAFAERGLKKLNP